MKELWPRCDHRLVKGMAKVDIMQDSETTKPILKITVGADIIYISANVGEMIGGAAAGARLRWEDQQ